MTCGAPRSGGNMFVDKKPFIYAWRPIYRWLFQGIFWPFMGRVRSFLLSDIDRAISLLSDIDRATFERLVALQHEVANIRVQQAAHGAKTLETLVALEQRYAELVRIVTALQEEVATMKAEQRRQAIRTDDAVAFFRDVEGELQAIKAETSQQWGSIERLLLGFLRDPLTSEANYTS